jgi:two-component system sensor histidine kinase DegS
MDEEVKQSLEELRDKYREELNRIQREASEIEVMVRQTDSDVQKLSQRELAVSNRVRDLEVNLDRYSKAEIKNFYTSAQEVQMRLHMMKAQLEQLQLKQGALRSQQTQLHEIFELVEELLGLGTEGGNGKTGEALGESDDLIGNIIMAQEDERKRISLQMHDGPAQAMGNLVLRAQICERLIDHDVGQARSELSSLKTALNTTLQEIRRFIFDLHPMTLEDLGLVLTLRRYVSEFGEKNNLEVNLMVQNLDMQLPSRYQVTLFRFVQEALNNVAKHANAKEARVLLNATDTALQVVIEDEGSGFHVNEVLADQSGRRNMGIASMRQQIEALLQGEFGIESAIGRGTRVAGTVPLPS